MILSGLLGSLSSPLVAWLLFVMVFCSSCCVAFEATLLSLQRNSLNKAKTLHNSRDWGKHAGVVSHHRGRAALVFIFFVLLTSKLHSQLGFELPCQAGSNPLPFGVTLNPITNLQRAWVCVDSFGFVSSPVFTVAGSVAFPGVLSGTNINALVMGSGGSLVPSGTGQISSITSWFPISPGVLFPTPQLTLSTSTSGGSITAATTVFVAVTYVGLSVTVPSAEVKITVGAGSTNSITVNMPTTCTAGNLPTGVTGCTVWDNTLTQTEKQQTASAACVNITTTTCVIGTLATGASLTWPTSTGVNPPNLQTGAVNDKVINSLFVQKGDGNYYPEGGIDISALNGLPDPKGTFTWTDRFFVNDSTTQPIISNALVSIHHVSGAGSTGNGLGVDDRALGIEMLIPPSTSLIFEQPLTQYNEFTFNSNFTCNPASGESCAAAGRFVMGDVRPTNSGNLAEGGLGVAALVGSFQRNSSGTSFYGPCTYCAIAVQGSSRNLVSGTGSSSAYFVGVMGEISDQSGGALTNGTAAAFVAQLNTRFALKNTALLIPTAFSNAADFAIESPSVTKSMLQGSLYLGANPAIIGNAAGNLNITASLANAYSYSTQQIPTPALLVVGQVGTPGGTTDTYAICYTDAVGGVVCSATTTTNTANATLTGGNFNNLTVNTACGIGAPFLGITSVRIYRTVAGGTPSTTGLIGTMTIPANCLQAAPAQAFADTGLAGDGSTLPTGNTTGGAQVQKLLTLTNCASSAAPAVCASAAAGRFVVAAGATTVTVNTTAVTANSEIFIQNDDTLGAALSVTCNTNLLAAPPAISARTAGSSFQITLSAAPVTNPECFTYHVIN